MSKRPNVVESKHNQPRPSGLNRATRRGNSARKGKRMAQNQREVGGVRK